MTAKPQDAIPIINHILLCFNVISWVVAFIVIGLCLWLRFDPDVSNWVDILEIRSFYIGLYILIVSSILISASGFLSCAATLTANQFLLIINIVSQFLIFIFGLAGAAVLMDNSTYKSAIHPVIKIVMLRLINLAPENDDATVALATVQENMGCCGGSGVDDFINLRRAIPAQCRDTVTGNAFYYGCADEITWLLEQRSSWITGLAILLCAKKIVNIVLSTILIQLHQKEEERR
ncbi:tetraspanin-2A-like [Rhodnius prolixus]|uniref:Tetraspanin n=2 Tax=Rhodnius TaxID=13248 RepID=R4FK66_RHOPR